MSTPEQITIQIPDAAEVATALTADPAFVAAVAAAVAHLAPPPVVVPPAGAAPVLKVVMAQNGATPNLPQDYSYGATAVKNFPGGNGNPFCIEVTTTKSWGGYQPSCDNGVSLDFSQCTIITCDVSAPKGTPFSIQFLRGGDLPIEGVGGNHFTKTFDGWETIRYPKAQLMTDTALGDVSAAIFKGAVQCHEAATGIVFKVDNWGGV